MRKYPSTTLPAAWHSIRLLLEALTGSIGQFGAVEPSSGDRATGVGDAAATMVPPWSAFPGKHPRMTHTLHNSLRMLWSTLTICSSSSRGAELTRSLRAPKPVLSWAAQLHLGPGPCPVKMHETAAIIVSTAESVPVVAVALTCLRHCGIEASQCRCSALTRQVFDHRGDSFVVAAMRS